MNRLATTSLLLCSLLPAQNLDAPLGGSGVTTHEGVVCGLGPDYSARFEPHGVTFTPALGDRVEVPQPLRFTLAAVRRGTTDVWLRTSSTEPSVARHTVRYRHTSELAETYDVRADGIEQSFVFAARPVGSGDLVVRGDIATQLPLVHVGDDGVRFERADAGGVSFGAVTGIDANGVRCRGSLRCSGKALELVLPAAFVDAAAYPLVLDPLIGTSFVIANVAGGSDVQPSVAYDESTQRYLVVWSIPMSTSVNEVRAALVTAAGFLGPQVLLDSSAVPGIRPAAANINQRDRFVVAWPTSLTAIAVVAIDAATAATSGVLPVSVPGIVTGLALGGDSRIPFSGVAENALLVYTWRQVAPVYSASRTLVRVPAAGTPANAGNLAIYQNLATEFGPPAVTKHAGSLGRWMYTLAHRLSPNLTVFDAIMVRTNGASCASITWSAGAASTNFDARTAVATRDGDQFLVAYEFNDQNFLLRRLSYTGTLSCASGTLTSGAAFSLGASNTGQQYPELDCARDKYVLAYRQPSTASTPIQQVRVLGVGLQDGMGESVLVQPSALAQIDPAVASRWSGGDSASDEALVVWASSGIRGRRWEATGTGTVTSLGGACGISGLSDIATYSGTPALGTTFSIELLAPTAPVLALIVGFTSTPLACGPCTIVPSADLVLAGAGPVPVTVPLDANLIGFSLFTQWLQLRPSACPLLPDFGFSNTLRFTIAE